jgi:hypothetical protein
MASPPDSFYTDSLADTSPPENARQALCWCLLFDIQKLTLVKSFRGLALASEKPVPSCPARPLPIKQGTQQEMGMPRKRSSYVEATAQKAQEARWNYLVRNPDFMDELNRLHQFYRKKNYNPKRLLKLWFHELERVCDKYGIARIPLSVIYNLPAMDRTVLESYGTEWGIDYTPVMTGELKENRFLFFRVDLDNPVDDLLPLIEEQLRDVYRNRPKRRRRLDKVPFNCKVYDLAEEGRKFSEIAVTLKKRVSTIKSAYLTAMRNIFILRQPPAKKHLPLIDFDPNSHCQRCPTCQKAQTFDDMCETARLYAAKDSRALKETGGHDASEELYRKGHKDHY